MMLSLKYLKITYQTNNWNIRKTKWLATHKADTNRDTDLFRNNLKKKEKNKNLPITSDVEAYPHWSIL